MALDKSSLEDSIYEMIHPEGSSFPSSASEAATNWTDALDTYFKGASDHSGDAVVTTNKPGLRSALTLACPGTAASLAGQFGAGFTAYWTGAVFVVGTPPPPPAVGGNGVMGVEISSVVSVVVSATLIAALVAELGILPTGTDVSEICHAKAAAFAGIFDDAAKSCVTVLITGTDTTPSPAGPLPCTSTGNLI